MEEQTTPPIIDYHALLFAPHVLIGGATGSGKSVLINGFMCELLKKRYRSAFLIDPKRVELARYRRAHSAHCYGVTPSDALSILRSAAGIMEYRYKVMQRKGQTFTEYSAVYIIIDELADLMLSKESKDIKQALQKLLQLGRAANVHIIAATQSPSRKTIPAELQLNFTHCIALRCKSSIESRQILGIDGAELLPRYGRALLSSPDGIALYTVPNCTREQTAEALATAPRRLFRVGVYVRR